MTVIARDAVAADQLVYAWPFPIGPECEVSCADDEQVVMCPAWMVGDRLGPGRHRWRTPDPMRPVAAFFVLMTPASCTFDMSTSFMIPATGQPVRLRATGSLTVRCTDPGLLIAQFVGLPFDTVNDGVLRSVSRSLERMLARLLTRRVIMAASPIAVTDQGMLSGIVEELVAYNPTAGAVFGIELMQINELVIGSDDGSSPFVVLPNRDWSGQVPLQDPPRANGEPPERPSQNDMTTTAPGRPKPETLPPPPPVPPSGSGEIRSGEIDPNRSKKRPASIPPPIPTAASGEILVQPKHPVPTPPAVPAIGTSPPGVLEVHSADDATQPGVKTPVPGSLRVPDPPVRRAGSEPSPMLDEARGSILGIGVSHIGSSSAAGEIPTKVAVGKRVLVPGPNGLMQSATVRQLLSGYYELEVGSSGETIWVPITNVVPEG